MNDANTAARVAQEQEPQTCKSMVEALGNSVEEIFPWDLIDEIEVNPELKSRVKDLLGENALQLRPKANRARNNGKRNGRRRASEAPA